MTYSNGNFNPNPLANPFNTRLGPSNYSLNPAGISYMQNGFNSANKSLPDPLMYNNIANDLHTPVQDVPFSLADIQSFADSYSANKSWNDSEIWSLPNSNGIDRKSQAYWDMANVENAKLLSNLTDEQKKMLADVERTFPASKFELVDDEL